MLCIVFFDGLPSFGLSRIPGICPRLLRLLRDFSKFSLGEGSRLHLISFSVFRIMLFSLKFHEGKRESKGETFHLFHIFFLSLLVFDWSWMLFIFLFQFFCSFCSLVLRLFVRRHFSFFVPFFFFCPRCCFLLFSRYYESKPESERDCLGRYDGCSRRKCRRDEHLPR